eukprot:8947524-Pyramimonas_sp.AAC.2
MRTRLAEKGGLQGREGIDRKESVPRYRAVESAAHRVLMTNQAWHAVHMQLSVPLTTRTSTDPWSFARSSLLYPVHTQHTKLALLLQLSSPRYSARTQVRAWE